MKSRRLAVATLAVVVALVLAGLPLTGCRPQLAGTGQGPAGGGGSGGGAPGTGGAGTGGGTGGSGGSPGGAAPPPLAMAASPLDGVQVAEATLLHRPLAVVIDNQAAARPQSGLSEASLVYEVLVEGGITRFLAFFLDNDSAAIGPVRSLRPYLLDLAMPLGAVLAHVGGSQEALDDVDALKPSAMSVDELSCDRAFWHVDTRVPPHNTYTGTSLLRAASIALGYEGKKLGTLTPAAFSFAASADTVTLPQSQTVMRFTLNYAAGDGKYAVTYDYDSDSNQWMRYLGGAADVDSSTGKQLRATTVIVMFVSSEAIPGDTEGRLELSLTGSGDARVFTLGRYFDVKWSKGSRTAPIYYTDRQGHRITLPPGPVWVLIAPPASRLTTQ